MSTETNIELLKRIAFQAYANGEINMDQRDTLVASYGDMLEALEHAREKMWEYGFSENDLQPIRNAIAKADQP